ncbi:Protoheme IX farnesyltransferase [Methanimicrococcus sp. At1]|uniref:Protoheme IX farnesyltransferase n=1 Tax=Methanimicrococcus hacksteinii TaxID=3028293 RepID=A0ABU3VRQ5_9EURY|nr:UbiA family prenyltransferase [Methanimicrococcus sp. At1]MDV0446099.1 Protoheme IX farnesyltransferase [Methanimicrococcus sp. At1]
MFMDITLPAAAAILAAYFATGALPEFLPFVLATIGGFCAITSAYTFNDVIDIDIDAINLPDRPLPSQEVTQKSAFLYALLLGIISAACALYLNPEAFAILILATAVITLYTVYFKRNTPFSFIPVGIAYGLVPVGIWLAIDPAGILLPSVSPYLLPLPGLLFGLMICMTDWGFTLAGVCRDVEGDRAKGAPTLPVTYGIPMTSKFILVIWIAGVLLSLAIGWTAGLGPLYFIAALVSGVWMIWRCLRFIKNPEPKLGGKLFVEGSNYRGVMFSAMIIDVLLLIYTNGYTGLTTLLFGA